MCAWNAEELTRLCNKNSATPPAELKTSLQGKIRGLQILLEDTTMLRATAQTGCSSYIQRINNLLLEAVAKVQVLATHKEYIGTTEINNFKTSLNNIKHRKSKTFADLHAQNMEGVTRDQDLNTKFDTYGSSQDIETGLRRSHRIRQHNGIHTTEDPIARVNTAQDTPRSQQTTLGKPSTRLKSPDAASTTIRSAPVLPEEHCDTADVEDNTDSRKDKELQETSRIQQCTVAPTEETHDVARRPHPARQNPCQDGR